MCGPTLALGGHRRLTLSRSSPEEGFKREQLNKATS